MMTSLKTDCRKFAPNIFNKTKCQNCFRGKDAHSHEALESNRATRKVCKCGYLFVAPDWDFSVSINRTKRWQRRWFILYDDGELTYSVDEHPETVPQAVIDMNNVLEVSDAEDITGNQFALAIASPDKVHFIKGTCKEESKWWFEVLSRFPRNTVCGKYKRNATFPGGKTAVTIPEKISSNIQSIQEIPQQSSKNVNHTTGNFKRNKHDLTHQHYDDREEDIFPTKDSVYSAIENYKLKILGSKINDDEKELSSNSVTSCTSDKENVIPYSIESDVNSTCDQTPAKDVQTTVNRFNVKDLSEVDKGSFRRYLKRECRGLKSQRSRSDGVAKMIPSHLMKEQEGQLDMRSIIAGLKESSQGNGHKNLHHNPVYVLLSDVPTVKKMEPIDNFQKVDKIPVFIPRENGMKKSVQNWSKDDNNSSSGVSLSSLSSSSVERKNLTNNLYNSSPYSVHSDKNIWSEINAKSSVANVSQPLIDNISQIRGDPDGCGLDTLTSTCCSPSSERHQDQNSENQCLKKGWLMKQSISKEWLKHWFVLRNSAFTYYSDPIAEEAGILDGVLDLKTVKSIEECESDQNYAFQIHMKNEKRHVLSASTYKMQVKWIQALLQASNLWSPVGKDSTVNGIREKEIRPNLGEDNKKATNKLGSVNSENLSNTSISQGFQESSINDDETTDHSSSHSTTRPLPPSPPVARTAISRVKERARSRSSSRSRSGRFSSQGANDAEQNHLADSDGAASDHSGSSTHFTHLQGYKRHQSQDTGFKSSEFKSGHRLRRSLREYSSEHRTSHDGKKQLRELKDKLEDTSWCIWLDVSKFCKEVDKKLGDANMCSKDSPSSVNIPVEGKLVNHKSEISSLVSSLCKVEDKLHKVQTELGKAKQTYSTACQEELENIMKKENSLNNTFLTKQELENLGEPFSKNLLIAQQLSRVKEENKRLKNDMKRAQANSDEFELHCINLRQEKKQAEELHISQMTLMSARVDDLTNKLVVSERNLRQLKQKVTKLEQRQERRRSSLKGKEGLSLSKEYESKLVELEQKIDAVEAALQASTEQVTKATTLDAEDQADSVKQKDATDGVESQSLLLRLHNLDKRVKNASETSDSDPQGKHISPLEKPKICVELKFNDTGEPTSEADMFSTSFYGPDSASHECIGEYPSTLRECLESLSQKVSSLLSWLKKVLENNIKSVVSSEFQESNPCYSKLQQELYFLVNTLEYLSSKMEKSEFVFGCLDDDFLFEVVYNLLVIQEVAVGICKLNNFRKYERLVLSHQLLKMEDVLANLEKYIDQISKGGKQIEFNSESSFNITGMLNYVSLFCNNNFVSSTQQSFQNLVKEKNQLLNQYEEVDKKQKQLSVMVDNFKEMAFSSLMNSVNYISEDITPDTSGHCKFDDSNLENQVNTEKHLYSHVSLMVTHITQTYITYLLKSLHHPNVLYKDNEDQTRWKNIICTVLKQEMQCFLLNLKDKYLKALEKSFLPHDQIINSLVIPFVIEISQITALISVVKGALIFIRDMLDKIESESPEADNFTPTSTASLSQFHLQLLDHTVNQEVFSQLNQFMFGKHFNVDLMCPNGIVKFAQNIAVGVGTVRNHCRQVLENERHQHEEEMRCLKMKLAGILEEQEKFQREKCKACIELKQEVSYLQAELDESRALAQSRAICDKCSEFHKEIQKLSEQHEKNILLIEKHQQQEACVRKEFHDIIQNKELAFNDERRKLEKECNTLYTLMRNVEIKYEEEIKNLQSMYIQKLSQDRTVINEEAVRCRYQSEIEQLKMLCEKGLTAMDATYQRILNDLQQRHQMEVSSIMAEKEKVIAEEARATSLALEALKKAHEEELEVEMAKFKNDCLRKIKAEQKVAVLRTEYQQELQEIKHEILSMAEKYSNKCVESAVLAEKLEVLNRHLQDTSSQVIELMAKNSRLQARLASDSAQKQEEP